MKKDKSVIKKSLTTTYLTKITFFRSIKFQELYKGAIWGYPSL